VSKGMVVTEGSISDLMAVEAATRIKVVDIQKALNVLKNLDAGIVATQTGSDYLDVRGIEAEKIVVSLVQNEIIPSEVFPVKNNLENVFLQLAHTSGERK
jgi:hypothetical protein